MSRKSGGARLLGRALRMPSVLDRKGTRWMLHDHDLTASFTCKAATRATASTRCATGQRQRVVARPPERASATASC